MAEKGYGELIRKAREAAGMERPEDLAPRIRRSPAADAGVRPIRKALG